MAAKGAPGRPNGKSTIWRAVSLPFLIARLYRRLGPRYLGLAVPLMLVGGLVVGLAGTATLALYIDMSVGEFALLVAAVELEFWVLDSALAIRLAGRHLRPVERWLAGERDDRSTTEAWRAAGALPLELLRYRPFYVLPAILAPIWDVFAVWVLDLPAYAIPVLLLANVLVYAYWVVLRFLAVERVLRPVLVDLGRALPDDAELPSVTVPLRTRLVASLPALVVITGAVAPGLASQAEGEVARLGLGIVAGFVVAFFLGAGVIELLADSIATPIAHLREATRRVAEGDFTVRVPVVTTDESGELGRAFNEMVEGLEERERLRETFGAYVDPGIAEHILEHGTDLGGEQVEVTVMFLDVRDFTRFAESADAQDVVAALNRLWGQVVPVIHDHAGHVDKFVGDGLLAVFGAPRRSDDHADQALAAACEIAERVENDPEIELEIGIGLNTGRVVAGNVGGAGRLEFSVIGDPVNVAARVEAATRRTGDTILVADGTRRALRRPDAVELEERPEVPLKGKRESVALYAPRGQKKRAPGGAPFRKSASTT
jgi:adenylate cyclase